MARSNTTPNISVSTNFLIPELQISNKELISREVFMKPRPKKKGTIPINIHMTMIQKLMKIPTLM